MSNESFSLPDIAVLYVGRGLGSPVEGFAQAFRKRFGDSRLLWITESRTSKLHFDGAADAIRLCTIESAKGMEFPLVFLLGLENLPRPGRDDLCERHIAYVGLTRAQQTLFILGHRRVGLFGRLAEIVSETTTPPPPTNSAVDALRKVEAVASARLVDLGPL